MHDASRRRLVPGTKLLPLEPLPSSQAEKRIPGILDAVFHPYLCIFFGSQSLELPLMLNT